MKNNTFKKLILPVLAIIVLVLSACGSSDNKSSGDKSEESAEANNVYPEKDINGIIMWGEGGATDIIGRTLAPIVESELNGSLVMQNKAGAAGAIATQYVYDQPADGYTLLFGAEHPNLYQVLDISERSYQEDFVPVTIIANSFAELSSKKTHNLKTLQDLADYAKENPGELILVLQVKEGFLVLY